MSRVVTLRLDDDVYELFRSRARADNRPLSNLIETAAVRHLREQEVVEPEEMREILDNKPLMRALKRGSADARGKRGRFVG